MVEVERHSSESTTLAQAREQFLRAESFEEDAVRDTILASWWRSRTWNVAADHIELPYVKDPNLDTPLSQCAAPILQRLQDQLGDSNISAILTDDQGVVLDRRTESTGLERYLDRVHLAPGFTYAEQYVGTNGIGTSLEGLQPTSVFGHEHYAEDLDTLACAGVPIRHPVSGQLLGLFDLTCWRKDASPLLMTLAKTTAQDIQAELSTRVGLRELSLFTEYLRACRRGSGIVFAVNNDLVMTNEYARQSLEPQDQAAMLTQAAEVLTYRRNITLTVDLPSGAQARMSCSPVTSDAGPAGGIVRAHVLREPEVSAVAHPHPEPSLPGIVGSSALWTRACQQAVQHRQHREWITVEGEPGTGKLAIIKGAHARDAPADPLTVVDAAESDGPDSWMSRLQEGLARPSGTVVVRHLDRWPSDQIPRLASALSTATAGTEGSGGPWVAATLNERDGDELTEDILRYFPCSVDVPPLRHHIDDVRELVPLLLSQLSHGASLTCSSGAMRLLLRSKWPGNVAQLRRVLCKVVTNRRSGTVEPDDLPPECHSVTRRVLSPLESMERDAIVRCLHEADGNKTRAAHDLGVSRATIYRKIRDYGIEARS
ncbi:Transcriptional regulator of acetoin/glycerol metabolism [Haloechinothrix alba]|uniref:Transcriptional regulator of acetoin/glycerol metabolism n=1 Tax=Haloechinothrix alba TaxID=664784 RepID=A0A238VK80_9PSEU|nr:helix-turn-helix domain-containing protein [Haloechinothrix alba]SNR34792.1 Transcriptional regulator of acetoin/glycerol metabolism [Haloechinothrix alba]